MARILTPAEIVQIGAGRYGIGPGDVIRAGLVEGLFPKTKDPVSGRMKRTLTKGTPNRRIISTFVYGKAEYGLHATKGYRARRAG